MKGQAFKALKASKPCTGVREAWGLGEWWGAWQSTGVRVTGAAPESRGGRKAMSRWEPLGTGCCGQAFQGRGSPIRSKKLCMRNSMEKDKSSVTQLLLLHVFS